MPSMDYGKSRPRGMMGGEATPAIPAPDLAV